MSEQFRIREANEGDMLSIVELWTGLMDLHGQLDSVFTVREGGDERYAEFVRGNMESDDACVLVIEKDGLLVGYCQGRISEYPVAFEFERYGHICDMVVRETHRRHGIGTGLVGAMCEWFSKRGISRLEVRHSTRNEPAEAFWSKMGFQPYLTTRYQDI